MAAWRLLTKRLLLMVPKLQASVYDILPSTTAVFSYASGSRKLSANEQIFVGAQTVVSLLQTTQIISGVCFITDHVAYASSNKTKIVWIETELFFYSGWMRLMITCVLGHYWDCFQLSEDADRVGGQLHRDKECPFRGVTKSGRIWRKVPECDARSECMTGTVDSSCCSACSCVSMDSSRLPVRLCGWGSYPSISLLKMERAVDGFSIHTGHWA